MKSVKKLDDIDLNGYTKHEVIELIRKLENPNLTPLIAWISKAIEFDIVNHNIRIVIVDREREHEKRISK